MILIGIEVVNSADLANLCAAGAGDTPQALDLAKRVATDLGQLKEAIQTALVDKVVEDFMDVVSPLKVTLSYNHFCNSFIYIIFFTLRQFFHTL